MLRILLLSLFFPILISCAEKTDIVPLVLAYEDFGPPSMAGNLIGNQWWQWQDHGDSRPRKYDIKVVVFKDTDKEAIKSEFPVNSTQEKDFRYLEYSSAIEYLDKGIREDALPPLTEKLKRTRDKLKRYFQN